MSCFVVSNETINAIVHGYMRFRIKPEFYSRFQSELAQKIGDKLFRMNQKSINDCYERNEEAPKFVFKTGKYSPAEIYGCVNCYIYQACEAKDWMSWSNEIRWELDWLKDRIATELLEEKYGELPWGLDDSKEGV